MEGIGGAARRVAHPWRSISQPDKRREAPLIVGITCFKHSDIPVRVPAMVGKYSFLIMTRYYIWSLCYLKLKRTTSYLNLFVFNRLADLSRKIVHTERFLDKVEALIRHALADNDIFRIPGHI